MRIKTIHWQVLLWLAASGLCASAPASDASPPAPKPKLKALPRPRPVTAPVVARSRPGNTVKVYALKYTSCETVERAVEQMFGRRYSSASPVTIVADERTNSLVVAGASEQHKLVEQVIVALDVPPRTKAAGEAVVVYQLRNADADPLIVRLVTPLLGPKESLSVDEARNRVLVRAAPANHKLIGELIQKLDVAAPAPGAAMRRVRIVWLVAGLEADEKAKRPLPPDMKEVSVELEKVGITNLQTVAQFVARCAGTEEFNVSGQADLNGTCEVGITGAFTSTSPAGTPLKIQIEATRTRPLPSRGGSGHMMSENVATVQTAIIAPPGHAVVLGVTPMGRMSSVFVVTVYED